MTPPGDPIVRQLRWLILGVMLFNLVLTLASQPGSFWHDPATAVRFDALSVDHSTNHAFEFFLGYGWAAYVLACLVYFSAVLWVIALLRRDAALVVIFAVLFAYSFAATNWLAVRWHMGTWSGTVYSLPIAAIVAWSAFPASGAAGRAARGLRWLAVGALLLDCAITLTGQPGTYWHHPETVREASVISRYFLGLGWWAFVLYDLAYAWAAFQLISRLPGRAAAACAFIFILVHFIGVSCWLFYEWRLGVEAPLAYGVLLSALIVGLAFPRGNPPCQAPSPRPGPP